MERRAGIRQRFGSAACGWCSSSRDRTRRSGGDHVDRGEVGLHGGDAPTLVRQAERDAGRRPGLTSSERERLKELERENRELRRANEILRKASAYFAQAELDRERSDVGFIEEQRAVYGSSRSARCCRLPRQRTTSTGPGGSIRSAL